MTTKSANPSPQIESTQGLGDWQEAWVGTLIDGKHDQTRGNLCFVKVGATPEENKYAFCCLGIACEVAIENEVEIKVINPNEEVLWEDGMVTYDGEEKELPEPVSDLFLFHGTSGEIRLETTGNIEADVAKAGVVIKWLKKNKACIRSEYVGNDDYDYVGRCPFDYVNDITLAQMNDAGIPLTTIGKFVRAFPELIFSGEA